MNRFSGIKKVVLNAGPKIRLRPALFVQVLIGLTMGLSSCDKDEIIPKQQLPAETVTIEMGPDYDTQFFFDLGTQQVVSSNHRQDWDIAFQTEAPHKVILNSSKFMSANKVASTDINALPSGISADALYDHQGLHPDSLALKDWESGQLYIIDRGRDADNQPLGKVRAYFTFNGDAQFTVNFAEENGPDVFSFPVKLDKDYNYAYVSFEGKGAQVEIEPPKNEWDLLFTQYTHIFYISEGVTPYSVNGVLLNPNMVEVAYDMESDFDSISVNTTFALDFENTRDRIGYEWKSFDLDNNAYSVPGKPIYIVRDVDDRLFKLKFVAFEDENFQRGYPTFLLQEL